jgi:integrase
LRRPPYISKKAILGFTRIGRNWVEGSLEVLYFFQQRRTFMSSYLVKGKGWRYDFTLKGNRYTETWFKTKKEAKQAEAEKRKEVLNPQLKVETPIDMDFLELINRRLDHVKAYNSERHYTDYVYLARRWINRLENNYCSEIEIDMIQGYLIERRHETSPYTANKELRYLRALFNFGTNSKRKLISKNPTDGIDFFPVEKKVKYVPPKKDVLEVISNADPETQDYLWVIVLTMGRMSEINNLTWDDINFKNKTVTLYTRKKKGGNKTPRHIPMNEKLLGILERRYVGRNHDINCIFWHRYWSTKKNEWVCGPYIDRKKIMKTLCNKANVPYFRFHALRHFGASSLDQRNTPIASIQKLLGHESRITTEIYLHSINETEKIAMDVLNNEFN